MHRHNLLEAPSWCQVPILWTTRPENFHDGFGHPHAWALAFRLVLWAGRGVRPALIGPGPFRKGATVLILTALLTVAALGYLGYAMIRPESF